MSATYQARAYGVTSAMPVHLALQRCPGLILIPSRMDAYREASAQLHAIFRRFTEFVEPLALDEAYLDVSGVGRTLEDAAELARQIKVDIRAETGLTASAGVAHNKFLAKLASDLHKPDGLTVIRPEAVDALLAGLPVEVFYGVGPVTAGKLRGCGIHTGADLRAQSREALQALLGKLGLYGFRLVLHHREPHPLLLHVTESVSFSCSLRSEKFVKCARTFRNPYYSSKTSRVAWTSGRSRRTARPRAPGSSTPLTRTSRPGSNYERKYPASPSRWPSGWRDGGTRGGRWCSSCATGTGRSSRAAALGTRLSAA